MTTPRRRAAVLLTSLIATVAGALVGLSAAPAQARFDDTQKWGYAKVVEPEAYLRQYVYKGIQVMHVDEEHMTADGFWFAYGGSGTPARDFVWQYQPFGAWCTDTTLTVQWNPWLNTHTCMPDAALSETEAPGTTAATATCRANTGQPWKQGYSNSSYCGDTALVAHYVEQDPGNGSTCAPWEDTGLSASGSVKCLTQRYDWEDGTPNTYWSPAPDACTGMPAEATKRYVDPALYVPAGPVPDCTGAALASNCPSGSAHQACTGVPRVVHVATGSATAIVTDGTGSATASKTASHQGVAYRVTKAARAKYKGKTYRAKRTVKITAKATRGATVSTTITTGTATRTASATCSAATPAAAQACANARAADEATKVARTAAVEDATARARTQAATDATTQAATAAQQAVAATRVSKAQKKASAIKAKRQAVKAVQRQIAKAKKRR